MLQCCLSLFNSSIVCNRDDGVLNNQLLMVENDKLQNHVKEKYKQWALKGLALHTVVRGAPIKNT